MKIKIDINSKYKEPEIRVCNDVYTEELQETCEAIRAALDTCLVAYSGNEMTRRS